MDPRLRYANPLEALFKNNSGDHKESRFLNGVIIRGGACKHSTEEGSQT